MSGGSLDYVYFKVEDAATSIRNYAANPGTDLKHRSEWFAFVLHLLDVADALKDVEWVMSADRSPGSELSAIRKVLGSSQPVLKAQVDVTEDVVKELQRVLGVAKRELERASAMNTAQVLEEKQ